MTTDMTTDMRTTTPPSHLTIDSQGLHAHWGSTQVLLAGPLLRAQCRCASCKQQALQGSPPTVADGLQLVGATPAGAYGLQLHFSDGHARGIYPWPYLRELAGLA